MYEEYMIYLIVLLSFLLVAGVVTIIYQLLTRKRSEVIERLKEVHTVEPEGEKDIMDRPLYERTIGALASWMVKKVSSMTPAATLKKIESKLEKAGKADKLSASDFLAFQIILGCSVLVGSQIIFYLLHVPLILVILLTPLLTGLSLLLPRLLLNKEANDRQSEIRRGLPDIMDLLVVSVEAGLAFDMALTKVTERFQGEISLEFQRVLREMQLGKTRKEAFKDMVDRVGVLELTALVNTVIQSEQLGASLGNVLRMQADLIREKRRQWVEEKAMRAPVFLLFPLVFCIFPSMFIILLGPAALNIFKLFQNM